MRFEVVGEITALETIAVGRRIRDLPRLQRLYGKARWRKMKGQAMIRLRRSTRRFAVCVRNKGYEASLERNKIYVVLSDIEAEKEGGSPRR